MWGMEEAKGRNTVDAMSWWSYVEHVAKTSRQRSISDRADLDPTAVTRWKQGHIPKADMVAKFARAYERPVLEAFVAAGFLTPAEADEQPSAIPSLESLDEDDLIKEIRRRFHHGSPKTQAGASPAKKRLAGPSRTARSEDATQGAAPRDDTDRGRQR